MGEPGEPTSIYIYIQYPNLVGDIQWSALFAGRWFESLISTMWNSAEYLVDEIYGCFLGFEATCSFLIVS